MLTLCGLYVAQGIPFGFVTVTFAAWLAQPENDLTTEQIGPIFAVVSLPWSFKFVWGPMMDRFTIPSFGRRRPWIIFAQSMAILTLGSLLFFDDLPGMAWTDPPSGNWIVVALFNVVPGPLAAMILVANIFVSMQDVAVDALAVDLLDEEERGTANGLMYGSSYLGTAIGGAGLGFLVARYGIRAGILGQVALLFAIMLLPIFIRERRQSVVDSDARVNPPDGLKFSDSTNPSEVTMSGPLASVRDLEVAGHSSIFYDLFKALRLSSAILGMVVALCVKIGIGVMSVVFVSYLQKERGWTMQEYTTVTGGYAVLLGLSGAALGGVWADLLGSKRLIFVTSILLGLMWVMYGLRPEYLGSRTHVTTLLLAQEFLLAVMSVSLFSMFMSISWPKVAATQFTAYMALMNLSTVIGSYLAGRISQFASIFQILILAGIVQAILVVPVLFIDLKQTRRVLGDGTEC